MIPLLPCETPSLRRPSDPISSDAILEVEHQRIIDELIDTMMKTDGVGIAAPQVGIQKRIIIVDGPNGPTAYINPKLISVSEHLQESEEGCLSVPGVFGIVDRHKKVKVKAYTRTGEKIQIKASGFDAIIFQHEIDHLDGILFIDRAKRLTEIPSHKIFV